MAADQIIWQAATSIPRIKSNEVHVWRADISQSSLSFQDFRRVLSTDERQRAARFHCEEDRIRYVIGRGLLRVLLADQLGASADQLIFEYSSHGKPGLLRKFGQTPLQSNLSHSGDLILIALTLERSIGVDVEKVCADFPFEALAMQVFSPNERAMFAIATKEMRQELFFSWWVRKEAVLKAVGAGLSRSFAQVEVLGAPIEPVFYKAGRWLLWDLEVGGAYKAAVAIEDGAWNLQCWDWPG